MYYTLKPKEIHSLPQNKVYLLLPESLRNLVQFIVQSINLLAGIRFFLILAHLYIKCE